MLIVEVSVSINADSWSISKRKAIDYTSAGVEEQFFV